MASSHPQGVSALLPKLLTASSCCSVYFSTNLKVPPKPVGPDCSGQQLQGTAVALAIQFLLHMLSTYTTVVKDRQQHPFKGVPVTSAVLARVELFCKTSASHEAHPAVWEEDRSGKIFVFPCREKTASETIKVLPVLTTSSVLLVDRSLNVQTRIIQT